MNNDDLIRALNNLTIMDLEAVFDETLRIMRVEQMKEVPATQCMKFSFIMLDL